MKDAFSKIFKDYCFHANKATEFYIQSLKYPYNSLEWQIARLQEERERRLAKPYAQYMENYAEYWVKEKNG